MRKRNERIKAIEMYNTGKYTYKAIAEKLKVRSNTVSDWVRRYKAERSDYSTEIKLSRYRLQAELNKDNPDPKALFCLTQSIKMLIDLSK